MSMVILARFFDAEYQRPWQQDSLIAASLRRQHATNAVILLVLAAAWLLEQSL